MELDHVERHGGKNGIDLGVGGIDEQPHLGETGRRGEGKGPRPVDRHRPRRARKEDEADIGHPGQGGGLHLILGRQAADLDAHAPPAAQGGTRHEAKAHAPPFSAQARQPGPPARDRRQPAGL